MPLRISLKPNERVIIGGAVIRNSDGRAEICVENEVTVLRESDVLRPNAVHTACERLYLALQLSYVDAENRAAHLETFRILAGEITTAAPSLSPLIGEIGEFASSGRLYHALKKARQLRRREKELIDHVS